MTPQEIKSALLKNGVLFAYLGTKWRSHYDPRASTYNPEINARHGSRRCSAYVTDAHGITTLDESRCDCHKGEWLVEPEPWAVELLELLDNYEKN